MRRRGHCGFGIQETYAGYGMTVDKAKALLKECRAGKHGGLVQEAARQAEPDIAKWIVMSIMGGKSLHDMEIKWELGEAEVMPCCRNSFYAYRKFTLAILNDMLAGKGAAQDGKL